MEYVYQILGVLGRRYTGSDFDFCCLAVLEICIRSANVCHAARWRDAGATASKYIAHACETGYGSGGLMDDLTHRHDFYAQAHQS